jgi:hypothetical protein
LRFSTHQNIQLSINGAEGGLVNLSIKMVFWHLSEIARAKHASPLRIIFYFCGTHSLPEAAKIEGNFAAFDVL